ncbi:unnamed protein product [Ambrosiozyma monospora]|uniref:Unnamed protein product n=1 Tax=Ambrosiozyma monospora TaxID=43982 RepID=A0ACB5SWG1_AMBMO|nr:unnamed protein product [Ambrosiozyma monospora]
MLLVKEKVKTRVSERVTQVQSEQLIETVLSMSLGCIAFLRSFFDEDHFEDQRFVVPTSKQPQHDLNDTPSQQQLKRDSIRVKTLQRGKSQEADTLLDWLEVSVRDSIQKKYLKGVCLAIVLDDQKPDDIFESYTFGISYDDVPSLIIDDAPVAYETFHFGYSRLA